MLPYLDLRCSCLIDHENQQRVDHTRCPLHDTEVSDSKPEDLAVLKSEIARLKFETSGLLQVIKGMRIREEAQIAIIQKAAENAKQSARAEIAKEIEAWAPAVTAYLRKEMWTFDKGKHSEPFHPTPVKIYRPDGVTEAKIEHPTSPILTVANGADIILGGESNG